MLNYENFMNTILKLQNCLKISRVLDRELVSKIDMIARPRAGIAIGVAMWACSAFKNRTLGYSDILYVQRRLILFLSSMDKNELNVVRNLLELLPQKFGLDIHTVASRCFIDHNALMWVFQTINFLKESYEYAMQGAKPEEPLRKDRRLCMNQPEMLPPARPNSDVYMDLIVKALINDEDVSRDPVLNDIAEVINDRFVKGTMNECDMAAAALIAIIISRRLKDRVVCAEPCVNIEAYARRLYNDLTALGADPERSEIYELYLQLLSRASLI
ncbi:MAG: hypothetical protein GXO32_00770 [Crenarchaeota archaeon]|nr:hypothetical protein [Thermoproteota archaeon]